MRKQFSNLMRPLVRILQGIVFLSILFFIVLYLLIRPSYGKIDHQPHEPEQSKEEFITEITPYAQEVATSHGIRPSVLVAQAALESNWGQSQLAREANNYFGIKNPGGKEYLTKEFTEQEWIEIRASFREYDSIYDSVLDYANLLKEGTSWDENLYEEVIQAPTYQEAAHALAHAGYATDPAYAEKVIELIEAHELDTLDHF